MRYLLLFSGILLQSPFAEARNCAGMSSERTCLLCNCYHETRGESINGMVAVGKVVKTRARSPLFPNSVCGVVKQRKQFSWWPGSRNEPLNDAAGVKKCEMAVGRIMNFNGFYALYYHNPSVRPKWAGRCKRLGKIGNHIFYKSCGKSDSKGNSKRRKTKHSRGAR